MQSDQTERYKQITRHIFEEAWNKANFAGLAEFIDPDARFHIRDHTIPMSARDTRTLISAWRRAFPDFRFTIKAMIAEDDLVSVRLVLSGTHERAWKEIPATGKPIRVTAMMFLRFARGKVVEIWEDFDEWGMRRQLGVKT